jgi:SAM-dependent methyltransferase
MGEEMLAAEKLSFESALERLEGNQASLATVLARLERIKPLPPDARALDIGAAQGRYLIAFARLGIQAVGVEPWAPARETASRLAAHEGIDIAIREGVAEALPVDSESVDLVHARAVMEHVDDPQMSFNEACRVLKPGGVFWFSTASSMCPFQDEIRGFPGFGWYPDGLKRRIMDWVKKRKPHLVGYNDRPAVHWFTPWRARRMLRQAGFSRVYDRWDLRLPSEGGRVYRLGLRVIQMHSTTKFFADILIKGCAFAAVK